AAALPNRTVVWLNTSSANYHFKGDPSYGRTPRGTYVCKVEADKDGMRAWANPENFGVSDRLGVLRSPCGDHNNQSSGKRDRNSRPLLRGSSSMRPGGGRAPAVTVEALPAVC